jgi:hypothetical protein
MSSLSLLDHFSALEDPRQSWKVVYPLPEVLLLVLCATLAGAEDFVEVVRWGRTKTAFLQRFLPYARGVPSHDTLCDVISALDPELFKLAFTTWVEAPREGEPEIVAIDGNPSSDSPAQRTRALVRRWRAVRTDRRERPSGRRRPLLQSSTRHARLSAL